MTRTAALTACLLMPVALAGCPQSFTESNLRAPLEFSWDEAGHGQWLEEPEVEAEGGPGVVVVRATLSTPDPCQRLEAEGDRTAEGLVLRVRVIRVGEACVGMIGTFEYTATFPGLSPGSYEVVVIHEYPDTGWPSGEVFRAVVTVG